LDEHSIGTIRIVIVDDDADIRELVSQYMAMQGIEVLQASSEAQLLAHLDEASIQVALLDVNLGREDGFAIARRLRARSDWHGGIIMLTSRSDVIDRVVGLELGADDYIGKPFDLRELLARVKSVARRVSSESASTASQPGSSVAAFAFADFIIDLDARRLRRSSSSTDIELTTGEFDLLAALVQNAQRVLSRDQLLRTTHGRDAGPFDRTIDVQIGRLRKKLGDDAAAPTLIKSVRGAGYLLATPAEKAVNGNRRR
jgi:two-component system, OmpR family, response regulator